MAQDVHLPLREVTERHAWREEHAFGRARRRVPQWALRTALAAVDLAGLAVAWLLACNLAGVDPSWSAAAVFAVGGILVLRLQRLYRARVARSWSLEQSGILRAAAVLAVGALILAPEASSGRRLVVVTFLAVMALLVAGRLLYRAALRVLRRHGYCTTSVVVIGHGGYAAEVVRALVDDPTSGFRVAGVAGPAWLDADVHCPYLGDLDDGLESLAALGVSGAIVDVEGLPPGSIDPITRELVDLGLHVQLSTGLRGVHSRRLTVSNLSYQAMLYLEPPRLSRPQQMAKRALDIVGASVGLLVLAPVFALVAIAIKLEDGGPVFYRQRRVGQHGRLFDIVKLRSMVVDADRRLEELSEHNQRQGPLFKLDRDPRITRVGALLRATSLDEAPQFFNVLRGEMSLVGPRPALPEEAVEFDEELAVRDAVPPGVTGLWQVESRDNASFDAYRRLDLFYLQNWSLGLDLTLLAVTPAVVTARALASVVRRAEPALANSQSID